MTRMSIHAISTVAAHTIAAATQNPRPSGTSLAAATAQSAQATAKNGSAIPDITSRAFRSLRGCAASLPGGRFDDGREDVFIRFAYPGDARSSTGRAHVEP